MGMKMLLGGGSGSDCNLSGPVIIRDDDIGTFKCKGVVVGEQTAKDCC